MKAGTGPQHARATADPSETVVERLMRVETW